MWRGFADSPHTYRTSPEGLANPDVLSGPEPPPHPLRVARTEPANSQHTESRIVNARTYVKDEILKAVANFATIAAKPTPLQRPDVTEERKTR